MKTRLARLIAANIDEDTIVNTLGITHLYYRRHHNSPPTTLTPGAREEVYRESAEHSLPTLRLMYFTTSSEIHAAVYTRNSNHRQQATTADMISYYLTHTKEELKVHYRLTYPELARFLSDYEGHDTTLAKKAQILLAKGLSYRAVAEKLQCSKSRVAQACTHNRQAQNHLDWSAVLEYADRYGISSAASHYKCSRGAIYYHQRDRV